MFEWHRKEKPVFTGIARGVGGFAFGTAPSTGGAGGGGILATGGFLSEYTDGGTIYVAHIFTGPGTFTLPAENAPNVATVEYLMVGGGGAGGDGDVGGGGGAGAYVKNSTPISSGSIAVSIGAGMPGSASAGRNAPAGDTSIAFPGGTVYAMGGTSGGAGNPAPDDFRGGVPAGPNEGSAGGSGFVKNFQITTALATYPGTISDNTPSLGWGGQGGACPSTGGGGGGGASGNGANSSGSNGAAGGDGLPSDGFSPTPRATGGLGDLAAGGGGGADVTGGAGGSSGTGGAGAPPGATGPSVFPTPGVGYDAVRSTGSGGGGGGGFAFGRGGYGSNGIAIIRYAIPSPSGTNIATGGLIAYNNGKCIHTFINPGSFVAPATISNVNYLIVGGGGSGSTVNHGGGGGSGALIYKAGVTLPATTYPVQVGEGANSGFNGQPSTFNGLTATGGSGTNDKPGGQSGVNSPHPGGIDATTPDTGVGGAGGAQSPNTIYAGGGGGAGGAGNPGVDGPPGYAGNGADGARYTIHTGNQPGTEIYFAGGGGGGGHTGSPSPKAAGGQGGGGEGGIFWNSPTPAPYGGGEAGDIGFPGANGFGGGGGGTGKFGVGGTPSAIANARPATYAVASKGGSGVVIIAYPI